MDAFPPGAALPDPRLEKNVREAPSPILAALDRAKIALGAVRTYHEHATAICEMDGPESGNEDDESVTWARKIEIAASVLLAKAEVSYVAALTACYEAGVLAPPVAAVEDAEAALRFALDEVAKRAQAKPNVMPGGRP